MITILIIARTIASLLTGLIALALRIASSLLTRTIALALRCLALQTGTEALRTESALIVTIVFVETGALISRSRALCGRNTRTG